MNTMAMVISQNAHISTTCAPLLLASRPRISGMVYEIMVITTMA